MGVGVCASPFCSVFVLGYDEKCDIAIKWFDTLDEENKNEFGIWFTRVKTKAHTHKKSECKFFVFEYR